MNVRSEPPFAPVASSGADPRIVRACEVLRRHPEESWPLARLAKRVGLSPSHLQRRFKAVVGVSPRAFQAAERLRVLKRQLRDGKPVMAASQDAGFSSSSRLQQTVDRQLGMTPRAYRRGGEGESVSYASEATPLGTLLIAATDRGLCSVQLGNSVDELLAALRREFPAAEISPMPSRLQPQFASWMQRLRGYIEGRKVTLGLPLDLRGTAFQLSVWHYLQTIPYGAVATYSDVARQIGRPRAIRAVANACAGNQVALVIPCHRVVRGDGSMGGYRWGVQRKQALLGMESAGAKRSVRQNAAMAPARS
jgi:AraC family transcriptional regulator, regulatory protein of adaptative response / methylated-DNA-[protein]-cysteine methyltransferase